MNTYVCIIAIPGYTGIPHYVMFMYTATTDMNADCTWLPPCVIINKNIIMMMRLLVDWRNLRLLYIVKSQAVVHDNTDISSSTCVLSSLLYYLNHASNCLMFLHNIMCTYMYIVCMDICGWFDNMNKISTNYADMDIWCYL